MNEASALLAVGSDFEYEGRRYHLRPFTLGDEAKFGAWREREAYKSVARQKAWMEPDDYALALQAIPIARSAGKFDFKHRDSIECLLSGDGCKYFLLLCIEPINPQPNDPIVNEEFVDKLFESKFSEMIKAVEAANKDPKVKAERRKDRRKARRSAI